MIEAQSVDKMLCPAVFPTHMNVKIRDPVAALDATVQTPKEMWYLDFTLPSSTTSAVFKDCTNSTWAATAGAVMLSDMVTLAQSGDDGNCVFLKV